MLSLFNEWNNSIDTERYAIELIKLIDLKFFEDASDTAERVIAELELLKCSVLLEDKNKVYIETCLFRVLKNISSFWSLVLQHHFYDAWCKLQDSLDGLRLIKRFYHCQCDSVSFFEKQLLSIEQVYPYKLFSSIGAVVEQYECSICGNDMDSLDCKHLKGELYDGELAYAIIRNFKELDHVAIVENPSDKRCVLNPDDDQAGMDVLKNIVGYIIENKLSPLGFTNILRIEFDKPNEKYIDLSPNDHCFCESGKKFKKCCVNKRTSRHAHFELIGINSNPLWSTKNQA
ncbi:TPA: hypothetical protein ACX3DX_004475 [Vibrio parahaemolyticus]|uniref:hypothetical protein n=1 Tax=Vibrio alginolyticus TaxID=663 RepID=UPI00215F92CA|nr:hypothetical protein [Vibrio alginolyticus]EHE7894571.1 hypothetical protein [Vibrio parahaemolyticus]EJE4225428.1 SEC-C domain-containing protein [Vibrio parahaemolyticus]EKI0735074.1 SEC-C domain-containing protein [Vibrio parahaemolyticus]MCS0255778.1 hypothetical protein [Vibrio alginolyticus]